MDIRSQSALLASIVAATLAIAILLRAQRPRVLMRFAGLCVAISLFYLGDFLHAITQSDLGLRMAIATGGVVPAAALGFFLEFLGVSPVSARRGRRIATLGAVLGAGVAASPLVQRAWARHVVSAWVFGALAVTLSLLISSARQTPSRVERLRLQYLAWGAAAAIVFAGTDLLGRAGVPFPPLGAVVTTLYLLFLAETLQRLRLLDLQELLGKVASLSVLALILAAIYGALVSWVGSTGLFFFNTLVASFVILILFEPLRAKVEEWVVATLFRERFEMLRTLNGLKARVNGLIEVDEVARVVLDTLYETRRVTHASIYLLADDRPGYYLLDFRGPAPVVFLDLAASRGILAAAASGQKALLVENVQRRINELRAEAPESNRGVRDELKRLNGILAAMSQLNAGITVPLVGGERIIGLLNLWDERVAEAYASDEIALVLEVSERLATVVENSKMFDRMKERDRLAALGEMAAGLAHEIRNPLGAIKGAAQFLEPAEYKPEDKELMGVIVEEVNRLNGVVTQFLDYSRPLKQSFGPTDLNDVLSRTVKLLQPELEKTNVKLEMELEPNLPRGLGDAEQLKQVFINLAQNSVQAMPNGGTLSIRTSRPEDSAWRLTGSARGQEVVEIRFRDTGNGIPDDALKHIFVPFYTTKEKGTGLGLAISQRIVKSHNGTISVQSSAGFGTEFVIRMPALAEARPERGIEGTPSPDSTISGSIPVAALPPKAQEKRSRRERKRKAQ